MKNNLWRSELSKVHGVKKASWLIFVNVFKKIMRVKWWNWNLWRVPVCTVDGFL